MAAGSAFALLADELVAAEEGPDAAQHRDRDGEPQRDDPQAGGGDAGSDMAIHSRPWVDPSTNVRGSGLPTAKALISSAV